MFNIRDGKVENMKKIVIIPDSFKGTMSSQKVCDITSQVIENYYPEADVYKIPIADGGEGTVDSYLAAVGGDRVDITVTGPLFDKVSTYYGILSDGTAVIETASSAGLVLVGEAKNPLKTTTFGLGEMMLDAIERKCKKIIIGLGGSCTNDGGAGIAAAMGVKFYNKDSNTFVPTGGTLSDIVRVDMSGLYPKVKDIEIIGMCDVDNPLYGENGAAYIFGPQKGASNDDVVSLDKQLRHLSELIKEDLNVDVSDLPGSGAAGGLGGGLVAFLGARLQTGIEAVLDTVKFEHFAKGADLVISGEGSLDGQSLRGKVISGIAKRCRNLDIPFIAIVGNINDDEIRDIYDLGVTAVFSINRKALDYEKVKENSENSLRDTVENLMRYTKRIRR